MNDIKYLFGFYGRYKGKLIAIACLYALSTLCSLATPTVMSMVVDNGIRNADFRAITLLCTAMICVAACSFACAVISNKLSSSVANSVARDLRNELFKKVNSLSFEEFSKIGTSSLLTRATEDVLNLESADTLIYAFINVPVLLVGGITLSFIADVYLALIMLAAVPLVCVAVFFLVRKMGKLWDTADKYCDAQNKIVRERLYGIRVIRAFDKEEHEHGRITEATDKMAKNLVTANAFSGLITPICSCLLNLATVVIIYIGYLRASSSALSAGKVIAVTQYVALISSALLTVFWTLAWIPHVKVSAKRVGEVLSLKGVPKSDEEPELITGDLKLENVSFAYPDSHAYSLENVTAVFPQGKTIGVIGGTGSGKSTLVKLLLDFYPVTQGKITFGGKNYEDITKESIRNSISCAMQKSMIFEGTIKENVAISDDCATDEDVVSAVTDAQLASFVNEQSEGLNYPLSQSGTNLSGGQKQRVNIARTILKKSSVYVFDDSFSALDFLTESNLRKALAVRLKGKTQIIITQRISTAIKCDFVYVLDGGKIAGGGTHEQLLESCEVYREIYRSQTGERE